MSSYDLLKRPVVSMSDGAKIVSYIYGPSGSSFDAVQEIPILMLHGNGESHENMERLIEGCAHERVVIALDSRGHGASRKGTKPLSYELMAADVCETLRSLGVERVHILGFSDGGIVALLLAMMEPTLVASMTLMGANLEPGDLNQDFLDQVQQDLAELGPDGDISDGVHYAPAMLLNLMLEEPHIDIAELNYIGCPVAVMVGEHDLVKAERAFAMAEAIPNSSFTLVEGCGHDLPNEAPARVLQEAAIAIDEAELAL